MIFFNRNEIFKINKRVGINKGKTNYYWEEKDGHKRQIFQARIVCSERTV